MPIKLQTMSQIVTLLKQLERDLRDSHLWQENRPSKQALSSNQPFCVDTLRFEQWLQFVFIEKMNVLIAQGSVLPSAISLCPMAEEAFKSLGDKAAPLINTIGDIDMLLSGKRVQTCYVS